MEWVHQAGISVLWTISALGKSWASGLPARPSKPYLGPQCLSCVSIKKIRL